MGDSSSEQRSAARGASQWTMPRGSRSLWAAERASERPGGMLGSERGGESRDRVGRGGRLNERVFSGETEDTSSHPCQTSRSPGRDRTKRIINTDKAARDR